MKYFTITELIASNKAKQLGIDNTASPQIKVALTQLINKVLDPLREGFGAPIRVTSGYRCPQLNRAVGGVSNSQHVLGQAADITAGDRSVNARLYELIKQMKLPVDQAINEHNYEWIHVSYSSRNRRMYFNVS